MQIKIKGKIYNIEVFEPQKGSVTVRVNGQEFNFGEKKNSCGRLKEKGKGKGTSSKESKKEIKAPITGVISKIFAKEGDPILPGQKILNLCAMKMENEIVSEIEGKIKKVAVKEGQTVKSNELLAELE
ncbi:MAG: acetyl-CoA carboxylase biotin carboxyl carrier protein subunit [Candidatus Paceibacterota bacterium]|jgi:biotin carboxyl carrier protein|nr:acetyl-CoA carboxylase biotin carboxyl carrier protein subunit [Candidatus Paceibacterota bacterium]MDD4830943.1 acetyl-CoA carboxylase biotin carboxyl carrier protein subunit [Candidatus Paceibacterota bacterium]MDD4874883.1 acetyl-CoA carboxylase biotin carboxyl carrier protein subunit [Candidatus Paceibacterota bacterium]